MSSRRSIYMMPLNTPSPSRIAEVSGERGVAAQTQNFDQRRGEVTDRRCSMYKVVTLLSRSFHWEGESGTARS